MLDSVDSGRAVACYRLMEEAAADGMRLGELSDLAQAQLAGLLPPEAEEWAAGGRARRRLQRASKLVTDELPSLWVTPAERVRTFDCQPGAQREDALAAAWAAVGEREAPVLLRGVGAQWPALQDWSLPRLQRSMKRAMVRVAPSSSVTFCRESHPDVRSGAIVPPSRTSIMPVREFCDRLHEGRGGRPPLLYGVEERCYLQALAPYAMMQGIDFSFLPNAQREPLPPRGPLSRFRRTSAPPTPLGRLWVSAPGTVSPLHYDQTDSYLTQVRGRKRLLLWPAACLESLQPHPPTSPLARRLRVDVTGTRPPAGLSRGALEALTSPLEAVLEPGDVLYFPRDWAHHTEAMLPKSGESDEPSFSLGFRTDGEFLL